MQAGTPPAESGSGGPKVFTLQLPAVQSLLVRHACVGSAEHAEPTLPKKSHTTSDVPSQFESSPLMVEPFCTARLCAVPVQPVSRSAPSWTVKVMVAEAGHMQLAEHWPGQRLSSVPSHCSLPSRMLSPQAGAHWQSD